LADDISELWIVDAEPKFKKQGSIIVFPSLLMHQVTPVTKGERYSAVAWATGPQLR